MSIPDLITAFDLLSHSHSVFTVELRGSAVCYLVLGFAQLVLQFREAEASHGDEVPDHSHKLIPTFPRPALLVVQLLKGDKTQMREFRNRSSSYEIIVCFLNI